MEILRTIWTALTTSNEQLINVLSLPLSIIEITVSMLLFTTILNIKTTKRQKLIYIFSLSILFIISNNFISFTYAPMIRIVVWLILLIVIFKTSILKGCISIILPLVIIAILEPLFIKTFMLCFNLNYDIVFSTPIYRLSLVLLVYLIIYILCVLAKYFNFNITLLDYIDKKTKIILITNSIFGIIAIILQLYLINFYSDNLPLLITLIGTFCLLIYFFISMYSLTKTTQLELTTQDLEKSQLYNKSLKILHDNVRAFKHDFNNIVQAIGGYVGTSDIEGLKIYYSQLLDDCQKVNNLSTLSPDVINNPAIYSILTSKYHTADEVGIKINLEIFLNLNNINMKIYEFTRILGILMDNAIEASRECNAKIINVEIRKDFKVNRQLLIIENTYNEKDINLDKIFEKGYSSKPDNTGLGLWEVRQILKKNNNLNLYTTKNNEFFKQQLEIYI